MAFQCSFRTVEWVLSCNADSADTVSWINSSRCCYHRNSVAFVVVAVVSEGNMGRR